MPNYRMFRQFLRENNCEENFDRAFYSCNGFTLLDEPLWETGDAEYIFAHAFDWKATAEGREYWQTIDKRWFELFRGI